MIGYPLNSIMWSVGSLAALTLGIKSALRYRAQPDPFTMYLAWFGCLAAFAMVLLGPVTFFTTNMAQLKVVLLIGESFVFASLIAQAGIVWYFLLNHRFSFIWLGLCIGLLGTTAITLSSLFATVAVTNNFIVYKEPLISTLIVGILALAVFLPAGYYFLREASRQQGLARYKALSIGIVYTGMGLSCGFNELIYGVVATPASSYFNMVFFALLLVLLLWPRRA